MLHYAIIITAGVICLKDTFMIQQHIDVSQLNGCNRGGALIQTGHGDIWVSIGPHYAVLEVQFILIARHRKLWTNNKSLN